jgi:hypothetical protein
LRQKTLWASGKIGAWRPFGIGGRGRGLSPGFFGSDGRPEPQ